MKKIDTFFSGLIFSFIIYMLITVRFSIINVLFGIVIAFVTAVVSLKYFSFSIKYLNPVRWFWLLVYLPYFFFMVIKANLQIAQVVINPALPIGPEVIKEKTILKSPLSVLLLTSSITLTPGTLSVDVTNNIVTIHCVKRGIEDKPVICTFEKFIARIAE